MSEAVAKREYPLNDMKIYGFDTQRNAFNAEGVCPLCKKRLQVFTNDFLALEKRPCPECGRPYTFNLYRYFEPQLEKRLSEKWKGHGVMIWGMGEEGQKLVLQSSLVQGHSVFLADKSKAKQQLLAGIQVLPPDNIIQSERIELVLIGTVSQVARAAIRNEISEHIPELKDVFPINEYLTMIARDLC